MLDIHFSGREIDSLRLNYEAQVDPYTGAALLDVPVPVTSGRNGMEPEMTLSYTSSGGNSVFGSGWLLRGAPAITLDSQRNVPSYNGHDRFLFNGREIVPHLEGVASDWRYRIRSNGEYTVYCYRSRYGTDVIRFEQWLHTPTGRIHWQTRDSRNVLTVYGQRMDGTTRISDPDDPSRVFTWLPEARYDPDGNTIKFEYIPENSDNIDFGDAFERRRLEGNVSPQRYLKRIFYGNTQPVFPDRPEPGGNRWSFEVVFDYGDHSSPEYPGAAADRSWPSRMDPFSTYRAGFEIRTYRLCRRILMLHRFLEFGEQPVLVGALSLSHEEDPAGATIRSIRYTGFRREPDGKKIARSLPPLKLNYSGVEVDNAFQNAPETSSENAPAGLARQGVHWVDPYGEGLPGILCETERALYYKRNLGGGHFGVQEMVLEKPAATMGAFHFGDFDRDGNTELVLLAGRQAGYFEMDRRSGRWEQFKPFPAMPHIEGMGRNAQWVDITGDGRPDLVASLRDRIVWFPSLGKDGFDEPREIAHPDPMLASRTGQPGVVAENPELYQFFVDMTGDGRVDLVTVRNGRIEYLPNLGNGCFGAAVVMEDAPVFDSTQDFDPTRLRWVDLDGGGAMDIVYAGRGELRWWFNASGNRWITGGVIDTLPYIDALSSLQTLDFLGEGTPCMVWSSPLSGGGDAMRYLRLGGDTGPRMLTSIDDSRGLRVVFSYGFSAAHYLRDRKAGRDWLTPLPVHRPVVDRREMIDEIRHTRTVTRYEYHDGHFDSDRREFRGFGQVDRYDADIVPEEADIPESPPACIRTWFHQGEPIAAGFPPYGAYTGDRWEIPLASQVIEKPETHSSRERDDALRAVAGRVIREETFEVEKDGTLGAHPLRIDRYGYTVRRLQPERGEDDPAAFRAYLSESISSVYEQQSDDPRTTHYMALVVDDNGSILLESNIAYGRRASSLEVPSVQKRQIVTLNEEQICHIDEPHRYEIGIPVQGRRFELLGVSPEDSGWFVRDRFIAPDVREALAKPLENESLGPAGQVCARLLNWEQSYYWNDGQDGVLPLGQIGARTLIHHEEAACFSTERIQSLFGDRVEPSDDLPAIGYNFRDGFWWKRDPVFYWKGEDHFRLLHSLERPDGGILSYTYDPCLLTVTGIEEPLGNQTTAEIDYHRIAPRRITDINGKIDEVRYDPLGVVVMAATYGKAADDDGRIHSWGSDPLESSPHPTPESLSDILADPNLYIQRADSFFHYDLDQWESEGQPTYVVAVNRETLLYDGKGGENTVGDLQVEISYIDGFGRTLQSKRRVESGPAIRRDAEGRVILNAAGGPDLADIDERWRVDGNVLLNRKQLPVRTFDPYFSDTFAYEPDDELNRFGIRQTTSYDAVGRELSTVFPDGSLTRIEYFPWEIRRFDANDTVKESVYKVLRETLPGDHPERIALQQSMVHAGTPVVVQLEPAGREAVFIETGGGNTEGRRTEIKYDAAGNSVEVVDPRGLSAFRKSYDLQSRLLFEENIDAGRIWSLPDIFDRIAMTWTPRGYRTLRTFDLLDRLLSVRVQGNGLDHIVEKTRYGEDMPDSHDRNLRGRIAEIFDQAGMVAVDRYDPFGNPLETIRKLRKDYKTQPDWEYPGEDVFEADEYISRMTYDMAGRLSDWRLPDGTERSYTYWLSGGLSKLTLRTTDGEIDDMEIIGSTVYDSRGQRVREMLGEGVEITRRFSPETSKLVQLKACRINGAGNGMRCLQNIGYTYDPVGNVIREADAAQSPGDANAPISGLTVGAVSAYTYDAHYRLTRAAGRVHQALLQNDHVFGAPGAFKGTRHISLNNGQAVERYTRHYEYDAGNNLTRLRHVGETRNWTQQMWVSKTSNRSLSAHGLDGTPIDAPETRFDSAGNCIRLNHLRRIEWNWRNELSRAVIIDRSEAGNPDDAEYYTYASDGFRVRKVTERRVNDAVELTETIYLDGCELKRVSLGGRLHLKRWTSDISDGENRLALIHRWKRDEHSRETDDITRTQIRYQLTNLTGSSVLEVDPAGRIISYEAFFPFGGAAFIAGDREREVRLKDYRYSGKERDDATGLYYFGYRYYASFLCRWLNPDPVGPADSLNLYEYVQNNPATQWDPLGLRGNGQVETEQRGGRFQVVRVSERPEGFPTDIEIPAGQMLGFDPETQNWATHTPEEWAEIGRRNGLDFAVYDIDPQLAAEYRRNVEIFGEDIAEMFLSLSQLSRAIERRPPPALDPSENDAGTGSDNPENAGASAEGGGTTGNGDDENSAPVNGEADAIGNDTNSNDVTGRTNQNKTPPAAGDTQGSPGTGRGGTGRHGRGSGGGIQGIGRSDRPGMGDGDITGSGGRGQGIGEGVGNGAGNARTPGMNPGRNGTGEAGGGVDGNAGSNGSGDSRNVGGDHRNSGDSPGRGGAGTSGARPPRSGTGRSSSNTTGSVSGTGTRTGGSVDPGLTADRQGRPAPPGPGPSGDDPGGSPNGLRDGVQGGIGSEGDRGTRSRRPGDGDGAGGSGRQTLMDRLTHYAGYLNFEFGSDSPDGESGGAPGGMGSLNLGAWGQGLYIGLSVINFALLFAGVGAAVRALGGAIKLGVRALFRGIAAVFSKATWSRIGSAVGNWWAKHSIEVAFGRGAIKFFPVHAAWRVGGKALHAMGAKPLYWLSVPGRALSKLRAGQWSRVFRLQKVGAEGAADFIGEALLRFRVPALNPNLALKQGHGVWSCITSTWSAFSRANYHLPNIGLGGGGGYLIYRYFRGPETQEE